MASVMTVTEVLDGPKLYVVQVNIDGDTSSEIAAGTVIDVSTLSKAPTDVSLMSVIGNVGAFEIKLLWDATTDVIAATFSLGEVDRTYEETGGLVNTKASGWTGDVLLTTEGLTAGENASLRMTFRKRGVNKKL